MKHSLRKMLAGSALTAVLACSTISVSAQQLVSSIPQTMSYQAVVRNANNDLMINAPVSVRISIVRGVLDPTAVYTEVHQTMTNVNGQIAIEIGAGSVVTGSFASIDWAKGPYAIRTETDNEGGTNYSIVGVTPLLSVPYALRAATADRVIGLDYRDLLNAPKNVSAFSNDAGYVTRAELGMTKDVEGTQAGSLGKNWALSGNAEIYEYLDRLGTTDEHPLIMITDNKERMRIKTTGELDITTAVTTGDNVDVGKNLIVKNNVNLNSEGGTTSVNGALTVKNQSATTLTGNLSVDGASSLNSTLDVDGATTLNGTLDVDGATTLNSTLDVDGATTLNNTLDVDGMTTLNNTLDVDGATTLNNTLDVDGATTLNGTLDVDGATTLNNSLDVDGGTTLNGSLTVAGATTLNNTLDVDGATHIDDDLVVEGNATVNGAMAVAGAVTLTDSLRVEGGVSLGSTLALDGAATLAHSLDVTGVTNLHDNLTVHGAVTIDHVLFVEGNVNLGGELAIEGPMSMNSGLDVDGAVTLNGTLDVDGATTLNNTLDVDGATTLNNTLDVDGATTLNNTLDVDGATTLNNTLDVDGGVALHGNLTVDGDITMGAGLTVNGASAVNSTLTVTSNQAEHVATIENTNGSDGDGLLIKLGKTHGAWNGSAYIQIANPATILAGSTLNTVKGWLNGASFQVSDLWTIFPGSAIAGALVQLTNTIIDEINDGLNLPLQLIPQVTVFPGYTLSLPDIDIEVLTLEIPDITIPSVTIGPYSIPAIPNIPANGLPTIAVPDFRGTSVTNSLTRENHYVTFQDKAGRQTGAIKAESVSDWRDNTVLDDVYLTNLAASFIGIDLLGAAVTGFSEIIQLVDSYNEIGVAYESGNGDYAEWLEREDVNEHIVAGDIVGVRGGKISKNIEGAEQTMVVSHKPIVLGNMPEASKRGNGNDIAFMGQVPVKILGPVHTGDYIVASGSIKGYGVAIPASKMKADDYTKVVGRSWENIPTEGPKMVNTVIGVHNGSWVKVVKKISDRQVDTERRVQALETNLQSVLGLELDNTTEAP